MTTIKLDEPMSCPYCLNYTKEFYSCDGCGLMVCVKSCAVELMKDRSVCCDCAGHHADNTLFAELSKRHINNGVIL